MTHYTGWTHSIPTSIVSFAALNSQNNFISTERNSRTQLGTHTHTHKLVYLVWEDSRNRITPWGPSNTNEK